MSFTAPPPVVMEYIVENKLHASIIQKLAKLNTGLTIEELSILVPYVESIRLSGRAMLSYLRKEATQMPRTIEIDPENDRIFIHLKRHNLEKVGKGAHKVVTYSILYCPINPQLVACAIADDDTTTRNEILLLEKFRGVEGIIQPMFYALHVKKSGKLVYEIITPLYNRGSLQTFLKNNPKQVPLEVKLQIARDILAASARLNSLGYVNRDNNKNNFFIHEENNVFKAIIGDIGGYTEPFEVAIKKKPFGPSGRAAPPDLQRAFFEDRLNEEDLLSYHAWSIGRILYYLFYEQDLPWLTDDFKQRYPLLANLYHDKAHPELPQEIDRYNQEISSHTLVRLEELAQKEALEPEERFEAMILQMLATNKEQRKTNAYWLETLEKDFACYFPHQ